MVRWELLCGDRSAVSCANSQLAPPSHNIHINVIGLMLYIFQSNIYIYIIEYNTCCIQWKIDE
jgi:hypothetical protein